MKEIQAIAVGIQLRTPILVWGPTGIGKTATMRYLAERLGMKLIDLPLEVLEPFDLAGYPRAEGDFTRYLPPEWVREVEPGKTIIFLDELASIPEMTQRAARRLIQLRRVGFVQLNDVAVVAASNRPEHDILSRPLPKSLLTRFIQVDYRDDKWVELYAKQWQIDIPKITRDDNKGGAFVRAFLQAFPGYRDTDEENYRACPRTWVDFVAPVIGCNAPDDIKEILIAGAIGPAIAAKFFDWVKTLSLPPIQELLKRMEIWDALTFDQKWAVVETQIPYVDDSLIDATFDLIFEKMPPEMKVVGINRVLTINPNVVIPKKYQDAALKMLKNIRL